MAAPIPDFTRKERPAVTRTLMERFMHVHPAHERAIDLLPGGLSAAVPGGKRMARP